jgi:hypothetical protein
MNRFFDKRRKQTPIDFYKNRPVYNDFYKDAPYKTDPGIRSLEFPDAHGTACVVEP